jgi:amino acid adenylation domain-containing protein
LEIAAAARPGEPHYALLQVNALICDARSLQLVVDEFTAGLNGTARAVKSDAETYFRQKLGDVDEPTAPYGIAEISEGPQSIHAARLTLAPELVHSLQKQARALNVTADAFLTATCAIVLSRTSGRDDVVFGSELDSRQGRCRVGMFSNTLPVRFRLRDMTAVGIVLHAQRELDELTKYNQTSIATIRRSSGLAGTTPLICATIGCGVQHSNSTAPETVSQIVREVKREIPLRYPIELAVEEARDGLSLSVRADERVDAAKVVEYMQTTLMSLVQALDSEPQTLARKLAGLPSLERETILNVFNATDAAYPERVLVHELFEEQVRHTPHAVALMHAERRLSYSDLNAKANQLARYLREQGVHADQPVALCVERSFEMVIGVLGILKAGGAYVPLDPAYPQQRLADMLEDANPQVLLSQEALIPILPATRAKVIPLDGSWNQIRTRSRANLPVSELSLTPRNLVYVIYTSGSTGKPKGVAMEHRATVNLIAWHSAQSLSCEGQRALQFAALSFDVAFQEIFSTLCSGGTLVLLDESVRRDPPALAQLLQQQSIHRLFAPPLVLQSLADCFKSLGTLPGSLRDVICAGEQLRISPEISHLFKRLSQCRLHNHYGPTETHVVTSLTLPEDPEDWPALPTIGKPIANTRVYVLDEALQPVPIGVSGEIYLGGAGVARGYLGRPELTAQRFVDDPFHADPTARLYRTGDLGRYRLDGTLEYLGRNDHQVKIRGYRIEIGEIEARLAAHENVKEAAVTVQEDAPGEKRLFAYVTARDAELQTLQGTELRAWLMSALPRYMIPDAIVILERFPLTPNGKLNRRALPVPALEAGSSAEYEAPEGETEELLAGLWRELLPVARISRGDNFFELGGHSLAGMKLIVKVAETFSVQIPFYAIFEYPTVREMAALVTRLVAEHPNDSCELEVEEGVV